MDDFHDVRFPLHLAFGASGGPRRPTEILQLANGSEVRNARGRHSRREYNAVVGLKSKSQAAELLQFFESTKGPLHGFRFRDPLDHNSGDPVSTLDQTIGVGEGIRINFDLVKSYGTGANAYKRLITKPVENSVMVAVDGVEISVNVDYVTGRIQFADPPILGAVITAGFEFDVPVRFASDALNIILDDFGSTQIQDVPLIEILYPRDISLESQNG